MKNFTEAVRSFLFDKIPKEIWTKEDDPWHDFLRYTNTDVDSYNI